MENRTTSLNPVPLYCCAVLTFASTADHLQTVCVPQLLWAFIAPSVTWCSVMSLGILCRNHIGYAFVYLYSMWSSPFGITGCLQLQQHDHVYGPNSRSF